jgi:hypothetical protein
VIDDLAVDPRRSRAMPMPAAHTAVDRSDDLEAIFAGQ